MLIASLLCLTAFSACGDEPFNHRGGFEDPANPGADDDGDDDNAPGDDDGDDDDDEVAIDSGTGPTGQRDSGSTRPNERMDAGTGRLDAAADSATAADAETSSDASTSDDGSVSVGDASMDAAVARDAAADSGADAQTRADAGGDAASNRPDPGRGNGRDVVTIGDSWMQYGASGGGIEGGLQRAGRNYRGYGQPGVMMLRRSLLGDAIPTQWDRAVREDRNIKTVIMTGGGNDIILDTSITDCGTGGPRCTMRLEEVGRALKSLWDRMSAAGVQDIVHVMYASAANDDVRDLEEHNEELRELCGAVTPARCHIVTTEEYVRSASDLLSDGIHPSSAANDRIARGLLELMERERIRR